MLQSRNRSLKRRSRFIGFLIIVAAGCVHRVKSVFKKAFDSATDDEFINTSEVVPPLLRQYYLQA